MQGLFPFSVVTTPYAPLLCTHNNRGRSANSQCVLSAFSCAFVHNWRLGRGPAPSPSGVRARHGMWFALGYGSELQREGSRTNLPPPLSCVQPKPYYVTHFVSFVCTEGGDDGGAASLTLVGPIDHAEVALVVSSGSSVAGPTLASAFRHANGPVFESRTHATSVSRGICGCALVQPVHADSCCSSAQSRPAYMSEECLPLQVCRTATSPCSRTTATCPSPRYHGAASPVSGRFPPQYAPCARSSVAGHWRAPCFLRTLPSARSKIACPSVVGFGKRGTSPSFASKQASDVSACSQTLPPVYQIAIDSSLTVQVVICDTFRGFVVVAAVMLIPWLLSDCRGELPSFVLSSACPLQHPFNTVPSSSLSRALLVPVRCPRAVVRLDLWRPSERDAGPQHGFVCSCGTASSPQGESHAGRLGAAAVPVPSRRGHAHVGRSRRVAICGCTHRRSRPRQRQPPETPTWRRWRYAASWLVRWCGWSR